MKTYKGFLKTNDGRLYCQPSSSEDKFYYKEGKTYTLPKGERPELRVRGFHACTFPMDVFSYYNSYMGNVEFHEVELKGVSEEHSCDSKVVGNKITIGRKLTTDEMVEISIKMMLENKEKYFIGGTCSIVRKDAKWNYLTTDGKLLSEEWFDYAREVSEGFGIVVCSGKYNFIDKDGKFLSEEWFDYAREFYEGFGIVERSGKYNYIGADGTILSDTWFDNAQQFYEGTADVKINREWVKIDKEGKILFKYLQL